MKRCLFQSSSSWTWTTRYSTTTASRPTSRHLTKYFGPGLPRPLLGHLRGTVRELGYAITWGPCQRYRVEHPRDPRLLTMSSYLVDYPFANRLYPESLDVIERLQAWGRRSSCPTATWSSSRARSSGPGLAEAVDGHVLIYIHKEKQLDDVERRYPAGTTSWWTTSCASWRRSSLGGAGDDGVPPPGAVCPRPRRPGRWPPTQYHGQHHRRSSPDRFFLPIYFTVVAHGSSLAVVATAFYPNSRPCYKPRPGPPRVRAPFPGGDGMSAPVPHPLATPRLSPPGDFFSRFIRLCHRAGPRSDRSRGGAAAEHPRDAGRPRLGDTRENCGGMPSAWNGRRCRTGCWAHRHRLRHQQQRSRRPPRSGAAGHPDRPAHGADRRPVVWPCHRPGQRPGADQTMFEFFHYASNPRPTSFCAPSSPAPWRYSLIWNLDGR